MSIESFIRSNTEELFRIHRELCLIPAPSHFEQDRAAWCRNYLEEIGAQNVVIDDALNVIFPLNCEGSRDLTVIAAHTDTVFPDREPMPFVDDGEKIHCPGAADDTASLAVLLLLAKYFLENNIVPAGGLLFVCNSCEEGLGNLKGTRQLFADYAGRIGRFITFDSCLNAVADRCVGSHRYEVEVQTEGGHSYGKFGNKNAIAELAKLIDAIYSLEVPHRGSSRTTYNVGTVTGGTSVNTIAQQASMLCEYRSDDRECLAIMEGYFARIFAKANTDTVRVTVHRVGDRPCGDVDESKMEALKAAVIPVLERLVGAPLHFSASSTDCNIPLSLGVPALCIGVNYHEGVHTREEWVDKGSMVTGLRVAIETALSLTGSQP